MASAQLQCRWLVYTTRSVIVVADRGVSGQVPFLAISRDSGQAREGTEAREGLEEKLRGLSGGAPVPQPQAFHALLGCIVIDTVPFLLLVSHAEVVAEVREGLILVVTACDAVALSTAEAAVEAAQPKLDRVKQLLERCFYFSHTVDVTRRLQRTHQAAVHTPSRAREDLFDVSDKHYVWNHAIVDALLVQGISSRWFCPVMQGFVQQRAFEPVSTMDSPASLVLVARRSCRRAGMRYHARGVDDDGEVANWVEVEQLMRTSASSSNAPGSSWVSMTQVRGSAPVFWDQPNMLSPITMTRGQALAALALEKHVKQVEAEYGELVFVSLLSDAPGKRETEGALSAALQQQIRAYGNLDLLRIDFHAEVTGDETTFDAELAQCARSLRKHSEHFGFFEDAGGEAPTRVQRGVIRTNCLDCLDRTNVMQYQLVWQWLAEYCSGRRELRHLLRKGASVAVNVPPPMAKGVADDSGSIGNLWRTAVGGVTAASEGVGLGDLFRSAVGSEEPLTPDLQRPLLQVALREMWADLGDILSEHYTGVASTMSAILRRGGHSTLAFLEKGWRSVNRAYTARFEDDVRQETIELLLGSHRLPKAPSAPRGKRAPCGRLQVAVVTWNLHGRPVWNSPAAVATLLQGVVGQAATTGPPDVIAFCFQEFMPLTASNVVMQANGDAGLQAAFEELALRALTEVLPTEAYVKVRSIGMVGLYIGIFVAKRTAANVRAVVADRVPTGLYGQAGNKGAVAVRLEVAETAVCVLSVHLESGLGKAEERAMQLKEAIQGCFASSRHPVDKHNLVVIAGDFNFRLTVPEGSDDSELRGVLQRSWPDVGLSAPGCIGEGVKTRISDEGTQAFHQFDELQGARRHRATEEAVKAAGLTEGPMLFPATYRLHEGSATYDSERIPAWTDRVLHSKPDVLRHCYCALGGCLQSDHRPVCAVLETSLLMTPGSTLAASPSNAKEAGTTSQTLSTPTSSTTAAEMDLLGQSFEAGDLAAVPMTAPVSMVELSAVPSREQHPRTSEKPAAPPMGEMDLLGFVEASSAANKQTPAAAPGSVATPAGAPSAVASAGAADQVPPPQGYKLATSADLQTGLLVVARYRTGWYYANVQRVRAGQCDVSWLRPCAGRANSEELKWYLCSTDADETLHGDGLHVETHIAVASNSPSSSKPAETVDLLG
mmetsp:Transcript_75522/g.179395  ORF Transcript_75522/g.179395 Transcript_75522/m.179395 type:complete len:1172 (-) Transcript_75522:63-3578(-)